MIQMKLNDWNVKRAIAGNPLIAGKKPIGRGAFSMVFDGSKPSTVFKMTIDRAGYWLLNCWVSYDTGNAYHAAVKAAAGAEVRFGGAIHDKMIVQALRVHSVGYVHGHGGGH